MEQRKRVLARILVSLLVVVPLGFGLKSYTGPAQNWVNNNVAAMLYEVFWCLALLFLWPRKEFTGKIAVGVFVATCIVEVLQLWHPWALEQFRATFIGRTLLGTTFSWWDFPHYGLGCGLGWLWMMGILRGSDSVQPLVAWTYRRKRPAPPL